MAGEVMETVDRTAPSAAITEKRANRLGGCVVIFFQLFDWNRRFAKRKLFSRKSLLPGKQASKRFGGNEKMPKSKINLIAGENRGGFPKRSETVESRKHEMRPPGLVARLMGLESMPSLHRDKAKKKSSLSQIDIIGQEDHLLGECNVFSSSSSSSREEDSGFDKSRPQKIQKTTTGLCDRRVVKKLGSEALQVKNVLTQVRKHHQHRHQNKKLASPVRSPRIHSKSSRLIDAAARILEPGLQAKKSAKYAIAYPGSRRCENVVGKDPVEVVSSDSFELKHGYNMASCHNCGSLVDVPLVVKEKGTDMGQVPESSPFCLKENGVARGNQEPCVFASTKNIRSEWLTDANNESREFNVMPHKDKEMDSSVFRNRNSFQNQVSQRERFPPEARVHISQNKRSCSSPEIAAYHKAKSFLPMNHGSTSRNCQRVPSKTENSELDLQRRRLHTRFEDSNRSGLSSPARKRRIASVSELDQGSGFACSTSRKSNVDVLNACSSGNGCRESDFVHSRSWREVERRKGVQPVSHQMNERYSKMPDKKRLPLDEDMIGLLLHQRLKELAFSQHEDETLRDASQSKSTGFCYSALAQPVITDAEKAYGNKVSLGYMHNSEYTSPGSVLETSFSNESCLSSSLDDNSGQFRLQHLDLLEDSATSIKKWTTSNFHFTVNLISHVSHVLNGFRRMGLISTLSRFTNARDVIIQTELLFGTREDFLIRPKLLDELMIHAARSKNLVKLPGLGFLVDAMIEYLELRFCRHISSGAKQWRTLLPLRIDSDGLIREVLEEVSKWAQMNGMYLEEIIGIDMEKWQDFEAHVSELGTEIAWEILYSLVGELAVDLGKCSPVNHRRSDPLVYLN
ncbi:PREDICTED: uncharacterized protein LOC104805573 [Tarenaya hassleriana]|uniref:uncharacterized protein LOC104805573 n=1 Tax=Tarenaya hassleriana TaxID=28532 RepID=UPI00053C1C4E|nr:PREDICTED: uncharacterized protein LOC104805573 [Tarenaya hassleriana]